MDIINSGGYLGPRQILQGIKRYVVAGILMTQTSLYTQTCTNRLHGTDWRLASNGPRRHGSYRRSILETEWKHGRVRGFPVQLHGEILKAETGPAQPNGATCSTRKAVVSP
jgi:hypothetical protein